MLDKVKTPARTKGRGGKVRLDTDDTASRKPKRKLGNIWREGRYLYRSGPKGSTVFDTWTWAGEPLLRRRA